MSIRPSLLALSARAILRNSFITSTLLRSSLLHTTTLLHQATPTPKKTPEWTPKSKRTGVIAQKKGMTAIWDEWGVRLPVTVLQLQDVQVTDVRLEKKHGHNGVQVGATNKKRKNTTAPLLGHYNKHGIEPKQKVIQFPVTNNALLPIGTQLLAAHFVPGQYVDVTAPSIGKGFQGVMKRWGFKGLPASHGVSLTHRSAGSTGQRKSPSRVFKGKKMAGRMGGKNVTMQNLKVVKIDTVLNLLYVKGSVPGFDDQFVCVKDAIKYHGASRFPADALPPPFPTISPELAATMPRELVARSGEEDPMAMKE